MSESTIRLIIFMGILCALIIAEFAIPRKARVQTRASRWSTNISISVLNTLMLSLMNILLPLLAIGAALDATQNGWGVFNQITLPHLVEIILAILILDFIIWAQHLITHKVPILWRLHRVHHADRDMDVTTAIRFHPVEIAFSMLLKIGVIYLLGPAAIAVIIFEVMLNGMAMFNHANLNLSTRLDRALRMFIVTPDMHRVHHSIHRTEHDNNYGFSLSIWDRLFGTYKAQPDQGHEKMITGLTWQDDKPAKLGWVLWLPFQNK